MTQTVIKTNAYLVMNKQDINNKTCCIAKETQMSASYLEKIKPTARKRRQSERKLMRSKGGGRSSTCNIKNNCKIKPSSRK